MTTRQDMKTTMDDLSRRDEGEGRALSPIRLKLKEKQSEV